ncbi:adenine phosphoribosyltransferase [Spiroplasma endosymbiont of Aspidapion aeneum]|uniref:adenine phosphoribosyltransferase n=1 Tax=Spiroplasma endosymbiont of Aspidapion aeneum TaxID=3066276 RepID=UPI00313BE104
MNLTDYVINIKDFPIKGVDFKDITPLLNNNDALKCAIEKFVEIAKTIEFDAIIAPESRGFIFATTIAYLLNKRVILVRKKGKLPRKVYAFKASSEYDAPILEIHVDDIKKNDRLILIDDVFATGGTAKAIKLAVDHLGGELVGGICLIDLVFLHKNEDFFNKCHFKAIINIK